MQQIKAVFDRTGNIFIPFEYQQEVGLCPGDEVLITLDSGEIRIIPSKQAVRYAQELVRKYIHEKQKLSDELIRDRRKESLNE